MSPATTTPASAMHDSNPARGVRALPADEGGPAHARKLSTAAFSPQSLPKFPLDFPLGFC